nr:RNA-directed DNA polymerase, eukaryota [Tanacetum cinerariifolium]
MGSRPQNSLQSKFDDISKISKSVFITNFPEDCTSKDIWKVCKDYGSVIDVFIPNKKTKAGKLSTYLLTQPDLKDLMLISLRKRNQWPKEKSVAPVKVPAFKQPAASNQGGPKERIVWVDIEGVLLHAWTRSTFHKIGSKWGEMVEIEEGYDDFLPGNEFVPEQDVCSDDESVKINDEQNNVYNGEEANDSEVVSDTFFGDNDDEQVVEQQNSELNNIKEVSSDPFNIYGLIKKHTNKARKSESSACIPFPPGYTPADDKSVDRNSLDSVSNGTKIKEGGSILELLEEMITVGGFSMNCLSLNIQGLGSKAKKDWIKELIYIHKVSFLSIQETKKERMSDLEIKFLWGNYYFDCVISEANGNSGGILCVWDSNLFRKDHHTISDNFVALYGTWIPNNQKLLIISVYAPQSTSSKRLLWNYIESLIVNWTGESLLMGDFNEVRCREERWGTIFDSVGANAFNFFITNSGLNDVQLEGYSFTWSHPSATKMSKLDRFLMTNRFFSTYPHLAAVCLDRHLWDHRPILLKEVTSDFGPSPLKVFHSWLDLPGFDMLISNSWNSFVLDDPNNMIRQQVGLLQDLKSKLCDIDKQIDQGGVSDDLLLSRLELLKLIHEMQSANSRDIKQKAKIQWAIEGDENSKYFHAIINKKRATLSAHTQSSPYSALWKKAYPIIALFCFVEKGNPNHRPILLRENVVDYGPTPFRFFNSWLEMDGFQSLVLNGSPTSKFEIFKGLRQGDLLFPFLFILAMEVSGLKINIHKSNVLGVCVSNMDVANMTSLLGCGASTFPLKYLGVPFGCNMARCSNWEAIIKKFSSKLSLWKAQLLSVGGQKKITWVKWKMCLASKKLGGLGIGSINGLNIGLIFKWIWRVLSHPSDLWARVITNIHGHHRGLLVLLTFCTRKVSSLLILFVSRLYRLDQDKDCLIIDRIVNGQWHWNWSRADIGTRNRPYLRDLLMEISQIDISVDEDTCTWSLADDGIFSVRSARRLIDSKLLSSIQTSILWDKILPRKVNIFLWRLSLDRLSHHLNLTSRGLDIPTISCSLCNGNVESADHVFFECDLVKEIRSFVRKWCDISFPSFESYNTWKSWFSTWHASKMKSRCLYVIFAAFFWWIWRYRNSITFCCADTTKKGELFDNIRATSFSWISHRGRVPCNLVEWLKKSSVDCGRDDGILELENVLGLFSDHVVGDVSLSPRKTHRREIVIPFGFSTILQSSSPLILLRGACVKRESSDVERMRERKCQGEVVDDMFNAYLNLNNLGRLNTFIAENDEDLDS